MSEQPSNVALPVGERERIAALDVLRGVALLGILTMNIRAFAGPFATYFNPTLLYENTGWSRFAFRLTTLLFDTKMMSLFSMLFGAGAIVYAAKAATGRSVTKLWFLRNVWLLLIGLIHGYLIWEGDILVVYSLCGLLFLWWTRKLPVWALVLVSALMFGVGGLMTVGHSIGFADMTPLERAEELDMWQPSPEKVAETVAVFRNGYVGIVTHRAPFVLEAQTMVFVFYFLWRTGGMMVLGQALMKAGVLSGGRSARFYLALAALGYAVGLPVVWMGQRELEAVGYEMPARILLDLYNYFGSIAVALGHAGLVLWTLRSRLLTSLSARLAAVGRMAFSNYLAQSVICVLLFHGYGLGLFGHADYAWQLIVVAAVWVLQLTYSPWWLRRYQFGPMEWLWRWMTYRVKPPLRRAGL